MKIKPKTKLSRNEPKTKRRKTSKIDDIAELKITNNGIVEDTVDHVM